jgi:hypothetical protein
VQKEDITNALLKEYGYSDNLISSSKLKKSSPISSSSSSSSSNINNLISSHEKVLAWSWYAIQNQSWRTLAFQRFKTIYKNDIPNLNVSHSDPAMLFGNEDLGVNSINLLTDNIFKEELLDRKRINRNKFSFPLPFNKNQQINENKKNNENKLNKPLDNNNNNNNNNINSNDCSLDRITMIYGRIYHKMKKLKTLDINRAKCINAIAKEMKTSNLPGNNMKHIYNIVNNNNNNCHNNRNVKEYNQNNIASGLLNLQYEIDNYYSIENENIENRRNETLFWRWVEKETREYRKQNKDFNKNNNNVNINELKKDNNKNINNLDKEINGCVDMIGALEESMQSLWSSGGAISYEDIQSMTQRVDNEILLEMNPPPIIHEDEQDILLIGEESKQQNNKTSNNNNNIDIEDYINQYNQPNYDHMLHKLLQNNFDSPQCNMNNNLLSLRNSHREMLERVAKACQPYCPYDIVIQ